MSSAETKMAIDALLSLSSDLPPEEDITTENATLMLIGNDIVQQTVDNSNTDVNVNVDCNKTSTQSVPPTPAPALTAQLNTVPHSPTPQTSSASTMPEDQNDTSESTDSQTTSTDTTLPNNKKKGTLVTKSFALPRRAKPVRTFKCGVQNCNQTFDSVKALNQHYQDTHPPVKYDLCTGQFSCSNENVETQIQTLRSDV